MLETKIISICKFDSGLKSLFLSFRYVQTPILFLKILECLAILRKLKKTCENIGFLAKWPLPLLITWTLSQQQLQDVELVAKLSEKFSAFFSLTLGCFHLWLDMSSWVNFNNCVFCCCCCYSHRSL